MRMVAPGFLLDPHEQFPLNPKKAPVIPFYRIGLFAVEVRVGRIVLARPPSPYVGLFPFKEFKNG